MAKPLLALTQHSDWPTVLEVCSKLRAQGYQVWLAGGCVRDGLLGRPPKDFDIATNALPDQIEALFEKTVSVGKQFGVIRVLQNGCDLEVATFRSDGPYTDGRHPNEVHFAGPKADAERRDFTINALFYDPETHEVHDFVGGEADILSQRIRTVGVPADRFAEDYLRILRCIRFVSQLGFEVESDTWKALLRLHEGVLKVSRERIRDEFHKLFCSPHPEKGLVLLEQSGLIFCLFPVLHNILKPQILLLTSTATSLLNTQNISLIWSFLLHPSTKGTPQKFLLDLRCSRDLSDEVERTCDLVRRFDQWSLARPAEILRTLNLKAGQDALRIQRARGAIIPPQVENLEGRAKGPLPVPFLNGGDLLNAQIPKGPQFGQVLHEAYDLQLEGAFANREMALEWLKSALFKRPTVH